MPLGYSRGIKNNNQIKTELQNKWIVQFEKKMYRYPPIDSGKYLIAYAIISLSCVHFHMKSGTYVKRIVCFPIHQLNNKREKTDLSSSSCIFFCSFSISLYLSSLLFPWASFHLLSISVLCCFLVLANEKDMNLN